MALQDKPKFKREYMLVVQRLVVDLVHIDANLEALKVLESELNSMLVDQDPRVIQYGATPNCLGGLGVWAMLRCQRLSVPPRRWKDQVKPRGLPTLNMCEEITLVLPRGGERFNTSGVSSMFVSVDSEPVGENDTPQKKKQEVVLGVEANVLEYYTNHHGWTGQHAENGTLLTLFGLLLGDLMYTLRRVHPLNDCAYTKMDYTSVDSDLQVQVDARLDELYDVKRGEEILRQAWERFHLKQMKGVNWTRNTLEELVIILKGLGGKAVVMVCYHYYYHYDLFLGGLPDLLLWKHPDQVYLCEVKGPGDRY